MRLPWNKKYLVISLHVIVTAVALGIAGMILFKLPEAKNAVLRGIKGFIAVFAPVLWAMFFSVLLEPMTERYQRFYEKRLSAGQRARLKNRRAGTAAAYITVAVILGVFGWLAAGSLGNADIHALTEQIVSCVEKAGDVLVLLNLKLAELGILRNVEGLLLAWTNSIAEGAEARLLELSGSIGHIGSSFLNIIVGLTTAFYFLSEKKRIIRFFRDNTAVILGKRTANILGSIMGEINRVVIGYLGGQLTDAAIMAALFSVAFTVVGLPYSLLLGAISGFSNLIPYFGAVTAFFLAIAAGLLTAEPLKALYAAILILILQQIDSVYIVPKVVGKKVELHPVLVLISLAVFGRLFGFWGLLGAIPSGALLKTLLYWFIEEKQKRNFLKEKTALKGGD